jgi:phospho-N-acetylmuramoyl-pentapeptide-transferase
LDSFILAAGIAAGFVLLTGPFFIPELHKLKFGQSIREEGPASHQAKSGTPTMGGIMIILGITIATLVAAPLSTEIILALFIMLGHFLLGFLDDYIKVVKKRNLGLKAKQKLLGQIIIAIVTMIIGTRMLGIDTTIWVPVLDSHINIGAGYYAFVPFVMVGMSNAVNLTDGLDGLASGTVAIAASSYAVVCMLLGHSDLAIFATAVAAACVGFLRFNAHPAKVFMGDTGSLALGGAMAALGILTHTELLLGLIGIIFVCEAMSVIIQVASFQSTGKRVFRMSPIHHHFELGGMPEQKIVYMFWSWGALLAILGLVMGALY